ncbi:MAG TPA: LysM peptidoglycan-binding domain-containing protein [Anaerolineales bacterium]
MRQYVPFLILNVVVSALTMFLVMTIWDADPQLELPTPMPTLSALDVAASAVPTATVTRAPSPTPATYLVQAGDTMNAIALELGVSVEALMAANGLTNPDTLSAGQVLLVPEIEAGDGSQATSAPPTAAPAPTVVNGEAPRVEIRGVAGGGNLEEEVVRLLNSGGTANMAGWTLDDDQGHHYTFPAFTLHNGAVSVHTKAGVDTVIDLYWGLPEAVWTAGKTITLRDAAGGVQSTFHIP